MSDESLLFESTYFSHQIAMADGDTLRLTHFGSVDIKKTRHALACGLIADAVGLAGAIAVAYLFYR